MQYWVMVFNMWKQGKGVADIVDAIVAAGYPEGKAEQFVRAVIRDSRE